MECEINKVLSFDTKPALVKFENGELVKGKESNFKTFYLNDRKENLLAVENDKMLYTGRISNENSLYKNCILIRDKKTNKVTLLEVDHAVLTPYIPKSEDLILDTSSPGKKASYELDKQFGSKRAIRQIEQHERLKLDVENVKEELEKTVADIKIDEKSMTVPAIEEDEAYRPPMDRNASTREQVFELEALVPKSVLKFLKPEAEKIVETEELPAYLKPFVKLEVANLGLENLPKENVKKVQLLLYVNSLIHYLKLPAKAIKNARICETSPEISKYILDNFSVSAGNSRTRPMSMRDKTICYILVLSLLASDYQLNIETLSREITVGRKKLQEMSRILGMTAGKNKDFVTLKVPLPPPISASPKRQRRK